MIFWVRATGETSQGSVIAATASSVIIFVICVKRQKYANRTNTGIQWQQDSIHDSEHLVRCIVANIFRNERQRHHKVNQLRCDDNAHRQHPVLEHLIPHALK